MRRIKKLLSKIFGEFVLQEDKSKDQIGRCCWNCRYRLCDKKEDPRCKCNMGTEWEIDE